MPYLESSVMNWADYDQSTRTLFIIFKSGKVYSYYAVPEAVYLAFLDAPSKGIFFNEQIKDVYGFVQLTALLAEETSRQLTKNG